jgi:hypothetical protein
MMPGRGSILLAQAVALAEEGMPSPTYCLQAPVFTQFFTIIIFFFALTFEKWGK